MRRIDLYLLLKNRKRSLITDSAREHRALSRVVAVFGAVFSILFVTGLFIVGFTLARINHDLPSIETLPVLMDRVNGELLIPTRMVDRNGEVILFAYEEGISRKFLPIDPQADEFINPQLIRTVTAIYDPDFWSHPGYQIEAAFNPEPLTLAEKLVNELLLWDEAPSFTRALRMRLLAGQVVSKYGRAKVLEWYLNSAWFGRSAYGAESAAQSYFGKSAQNLTLAESALLTSTLGSPGLNPIDAPQIAFKSQQELLGKMLTSGVILREEYDLAIREDIVLREINEGMAANNAGFVRQVEKQLETLIGFQRLRRGGLIIKTTIDADLQSQLSCTATTQLLRVQSSDVSGVAPEGLECEADGLLPTQGFSKLSGQGLAAAGLVMNPSTGEVLAYLEPLTLSGEQLRDSDYQPGSLLTPIVAINAFSRGYSPASLTWDVPASIDVGDEDLSNYHGPVSLRTAISNDYLAPVIKLTNEIGADNVWRTAILLGLNSMGTAPSDASPLTSGSETSLSQLGIAFSTLANQGERIGRLDPQSGAILPETILQVTTISGESIRERSEIESSVILDKPLAYLINHVLSDENARTPSLGYPNELEIGKPVAVKVGSADNHHQVWTVGYTPDRMVLIWMGNTAGSEPELSERVAAGLWHAIFKYTSQGSQFSGWSMPAGVNEIKVCSPSGMLPTAECPEVVQEVFLYGYEPAMTDTLYKQEKVNRESGMLATVFTPPGLVEERTYLDIPVEARPWAEAAGIDLPPQGYDTIQVPRIDPQVYISTPKLFSVDSGSVKIRGTATGEDFASYSVQVGEGINPQTWQQVGETLNQPVMDDLLTTWDTTGLNGLYAIKVIVIDKQNLVKTAITQVTVDNTPPTATILYPLTGSQVQPVGGGVTLNAAVEDQVGIASVDWWVDTKLVLTQITAPYVYQLEASNGTHQVYLVVHDTAGNETVTDFVSFQVKP